MATKKTQLKDSTTGEKMYPVTSSACVGMSDGSGSLDKHLAKITTEYNVSKFHPTGGSGGSNKYDLSTAIGKVPEELRVPGLVVSFLNQQSKVEKRTYQGGTWAAVSFIRQEAGGNKILEWNTDVETTRKQVLQQERKPGMQISYKDPEKGWINEQYMGTAVTDIEWVKNTNWERMATNKDVLVPNVLSIKPSDMSQGLLSRNDGTLSESTLYITSDFVEIPKSTSKITFTVIYASGAPCICFYSDKKESTFINFKTGSSTGSSVDWGDAKYFRFCFSKTNNTDANGAGVTVEYTKNIVEEFSNTYNEISKANEYTSEVDADLQDYKNEILVEEIYNTQVIRSGGETGSVNADGSVDTENTANGIISKYYDITNVVRIVIHCSDTVVRQSYLFLYDNDKALIKNYSKIHNSSNDIDIVPPSNAKYMKWGYWQHNGDFIMYKRKIDDYINYSNVIKQNVLNYGGYKLYKQYVYPYFTQCGLIIEPQTGIVKVFTEQPDAMASTALDSTSYVDIQGVVRIDAYLSLNSTSVAFAFFDEDKKTIISYSKNEGVLIEGEAYKFENVEIPWNARYVAFNANRTTKYKYIILHRYSDRPLKNIGGASAIPFTYTVDSAFDDFGDKLKSTSEQNKPEIGEDEGSLILPKKYTPDGEPTKLIMYCHGASDKVVGAESRPLDLMGDRFAVVMFNGTPTNRRNKEFCGDGISMGNWQFIRCASAVYQYCCDNFNIDRSGIYLCGTSLGGLCALNIAMSGCIPVRAIALDAPVIDLFHDAYFNGAWLDSNSGGSTPIMVAWCYNWDGIDWDKKTYTLSNGLDKPISELKNNGADMTELWEMNKDKMIGFNAYKTNDFLVKNLDKSHVYQTTGANEKAILTDNDQLYFGKKLPCPIKIWFANIDAINQIDIAKRFLQKTRNGGTISVFRTVTAATHGVTRFKYVVDEIVNWFKRW